MSSSTPQAPAVHHGIYCDGCGVYPIVGIRYTCANCANYDLCEACEAQDNHDHTHVFLKIRRPLPPPLVVCCCRRYRAKNSRHPTAHS